MSDRHDRQRGWYPASSEFPVKNHEAATSTSAQRKEAHGGRETTNLPANRLYWAVALDENSTKRLRNHVLRLLDAPGTLPPGAQPSQFQLRQEFHCTLLFMGRDRSKEPPLLDLIGREASVAVNFFAATNRLVCAEVTLLDAEVAAVCHNAWPHLTLALAAGAAAKESNDVLHAVHRDRREGIVLTQPASDGEEDHGRLVLKGVVRPMVR